MKLASSVDKYVFESMVNCKRTTLLQYLAKISGDLRREKTLFYKLDYATELNCENNKYIQDMVNFMLEVDAMAGDITKIDSFGVIEENAERKLVLVDYGINYETYWKHYTDNDDRYKPTSYIN